jgi:molybdate transport system regulatory protein
MIEVEFSISVKKDGIMFLNPLKTQLLEEIKRNGSLSSTAKKMDISYQHLWNMIDEMNRAAQIPLVLKQRGGSNGGGATVTGYGERMIKEYLIIQAEIRKVVDQINVEINL